MDVGLISAPTENSSASSQPRKTGWGWAVYRSSLILGGILWICVASTFCGCARTNAMVMNKSGQGHYKKGNYTAARYEFERALMDDPYNPNYAFNVAKAMEKQGDIHGAEKMYQHSLTLSPTHQPAYSALSEMLLAQGRSAEANQLLNAWSEAQPYNPDARVELAKLQQRQGDIFSAEQQLQMALQADPRNTAALNQMGELNQQLGRSDLAANYYQQALNQNPYQPEVNSRLQALREGHRPSPALQMASHMPQMDPSMAGGSVVAASYSGQQTAQMGYPMEMQMASAPMMNGNGIVSVTPQQSMAHHQVMLPTQMMPHGPVAAPMMSGQPVVYNAPGALVPPQQISPTPVPQQGMSVMSGPAQLTPPPQPMPVSHPVPQHPVDLGQPGPMTQVSHEVHTPATASPLPVVQAF